MIHCAPVADSDRSWRRLGIAIATIVWSMNVIATANTLAASTRFLFEARPIGGHLRRAPQGRVVISRLLSVDERERVVHPGQREQLACLGGQGRADREPAAVQLRGADSREDRAEAGRVD